MAIVGSAEIVIHAITTGFKKEVEDALKNIDMGGSGEKLGEDLDDGIRRGAGKNKKSYFSDKFITEAKKSATAFTRILNIGDAQGPAISTAVSGLSSLVSGLFAVGSAAGAAAPALAVLPGLLSAVAQAGIAAKLAFGGVGKAISALNKNKSGGGEKNTNDNAIADARKRLARAYQTAADSMASANDKVRKSQNALNAAYKAGAESLQQLGFDAEDAAIAESKAAIELERARETLLRTQDMPPDSRMRREAELAFKEADLNYRQAKDKANDLAEAQKYAKETGIEGTKEVLSAKQDLNDAEQDRAKTERDNAQSIADAQEAVARALQKTASAASSVQDPLAGLSKEAAHFAQYIHDLQPEFKKLKDAAGVELFPKLEKAIQPLVDKLFPVLLPILRDTGGALGDVAIGFSKMLTKATTLNKIDIIGKNNVGVIKDLGGAATFLSEALINILAAAAPLTREFSKWIEGKAEKIRDATSNTKDLTDKITAAGVIAKQIGRIFSNLGDYFKIMGGEAKGGGQIILDYFEKATKGLADFAAAGAKDGSLKIFFENAATNFTKIFGLIGKIIGAFAKLGGDKNVGKTADNLLPAVDALEGIATTLNEAGPALGDLATKIAKLAKNLAGGANGAKYFLDTLGKGVDILNAVFGNSVVQQIMRVVSPILAVVRAIGLMIAVVKLSSRILQGNIFKLFGIRTAKEQAAIAARKQEIAEQRLALKTKISTAFTKAQTAAQKLATGAKNLAITASNKLRAALSKENIAKNLNAIKTKLQALWEGVLNGIRKVGTIIQAAFNAVMALNPITLIVIAVVALIAAFVLLYRRSETFRNLISRIGEVGRAAFDAIMDAVRTVIDWVRTNWPLLLAIITGPIGLAVLFITRNWDTIREVIANAIARIREIGASIWNWITERLSALWERVQGIWDTIIGFVRGLGRRIAEAASGIWNWFVERLSNIWERVQGIWDTIIGFVRGLGRRIAEAASGLWDGMRSGLSGVINFIISGINFIIRALNGIKVTVPDWVPGIGGSKFGFDIDELKPVQLAKGGIVRPTSGGTLARIGEAGRPERVEPLDPNGLSARDKAIIAEFITKSNGGKSSGGNTFIVNPSPGMDEIELAHQVSRNVTWAMKRGA
jgi:phage-related protein